MKLKRMFSLVGTLAMLMSVVFLISGCKSQTQRGQGDSEQVTITYSTEHGTAPASKQVDKNYKLTAGDLPSLSATGFVFEGWYIGTSKVNVGYTVNKNITLSAKWEIEQSGVEKVTISYSTEHGTAPASKQVDKNYKLTAGDLPSLSATGFVFEGWYIGTSKVNVGYTVNKNITLSAKWEIEQSGVEKVTISYSTEHGRAPASKTVDEGYKLTAEDLASPGEWHRYIFNGWYDGSACMNVGDAVFRDMTLTAKWISVPDKKVTISYSTEHGIAPQKKIVDEGHKLRESDLNPINADGFTFEGWYIGSDKATLGCVVNQNITLKARWGAGSSEKVTISYSTEKGTAPASKTVNVGYKLTRADLPFLSADGFIFNGWHIGEEKVTLGYAVNTNLTLTAKWTEPSYISFTTSREVGRTISLDIDAKPEDRPYVFIDFNNNGIIDEGENIQYFGHDINGYTRQTYTIVNQTFKIYGNITSLRSTRNNITDIDFKNCTALENIICVEPMLKNLDVSGCKALKTLYCANLRFSTLNLKDCKKLEYLWCRYNEIETLDMSGCIALKDLRCEKNKLTSLNVRGCIALESLYCSRNELTSLDASGLASLKNLQCWDNKLTNLDVGGDSALKILSFTDNNIESVNLKDCKALKGLGCSLNKLTRLDVSENKKLLVLHALKNKIEGANMDALIASLPTISPSAEAFNEGVTVAEITPLDLSDDVMVDKLLSYFNKNIESVNLIETNMDIPMESLPIFSPTAGNTYGKFIIINSKSTLQEGNTYTPQNISDAKAKNWKVYDLNGSLSPSAHIEL